MRFPMLTHYLLCDECEINSPIYDEAGAALEAAVELGWQVPCESNRHECLCPDCVGYVDAFEVVGWADIGGEAGGA